MQLEIFSKYKSEFREFCLIKKGELEKQLDEINKLLNDIDEHSIISKAIKSDIENKTESRDIVKLENGYIIQWSWVKKIIFILSNTNSALTAKQITDEVLKLEPNQDWKQVNSVISGQLSLKIKADKDFVREKNEIGEFAYSLKK